ncbi:hypothetical protein KLP40_14760 [Hymenobacter sp. NST-14]|uniref:hypothetical protein n=1 Tax=Hymenobacter piscis TaxID=2839984 RepID=UPI001C011DBA|nr:hypothetical protein [Hymenobacter piscis]MBT9394430.1 hypothetical protein [Hymenobacter piscis]
MSNFSTIDQAYLPVASAAVQEAATFLLASHPATRGLFPPGGGAPLLNMLLGFFSFPIDEIISLLERGTQKYPASPLPKTQYICSSFRKGSRRQFELVVQTATLSLQSARATTPDQQAQARLQQLFAN